MDAINFSFTYTTRFIIPLLFDKNITHEEVFNESFINAFIADIENKDNDDKIHLLFADYPSLTLQKKLPEPVAEYQHGDRYILVYEIPVEYADEYTKFLIGSYSKFKDETKQRILDFWKANENTLLHGVLYKEGDKIKKFMKKELNTDITKLSTKMEWWAAPKIENEILGLAN